MPAEEKEAKEEEDDDDEELDGDYGIDIEDVPHAAHIDALFGRFGGREGTISYEDAQAEEADEEEDHDVDAEEDDNDRGPSPARRGRIR